MSARRQQILLHVDVSLSPLNRPQGNKIYWRKTVRQTFGWVTHTTVCIRSTASYHVINVATQHPCPSGCTSRMSLLFAASHSDWAASSTKPQKGRDCPIMSTIPSSHCWLAVRFSALDLHFFMFFQKSAIVGNKRQKTPQYCLELVSRQDGFMVNKGDRTLAVNLCCSIQSAYTSQWSFNLFTEPYKFQQSLMMVPFLLVRISSGM